MLTDELLQRVPKDALRGTRCACFASVLVALPTICVNLPRILYRTAEKPTASLPWMAAEVLAAKLVRVPMGSSPSVASARSSFVGVALHLER